jgi:hypothetical protein
MCETAFDFLGSVAIVLSIRHTQPCDTKESFDERNSGRPSGPAIAKARRIEILSGPLWNRQMSQDL